MTDQKKYPPSGAIFKSKSTHPKAPTMSGTLEISGELLQHLISKGQAGAKIEMEIAAYENTHPNHGVWYRLIARKPFVRQQAQGRTNYVRRKSDELPF